MSIIIKNIVTPANTLIPFELILSNKELVIIIHRRKMLARVKNLALNPVLVLELIFLKNKPIIQINTGGKKETNQQIVIVAKNKTTEFYYSSKT